MRHRGGGQALTPRHRGRPNRRRIAGGFAVSALLHIVVIGALLLRLDWKREPEMLPPPATVSMVFDGGRPEGPTTLKPTPEPERFSTPPSELGGPVVGLQTAPLQPPPASPPSHPPETALLEPPKAQPSTSPPTPVAPPPPSPEAPTEPGPAEIVPPPAPSAPSREAKPEASPPVRQSQPEQHPPDFPAPMQFSFGSPGATPGAATPGKPLLSLGLSKRGPEDASPFSMDTSAEVGPDWRNELTEWVQEHSYYPQQAAELGQQGPSRVLVVVKADGEVASVELEKSSGSPWLDLALQGLFRGAKLPPLPKHLGEEPLELHFTMYYILRH
jgi:protein TonB